MRPCVGRDPELTGLADLVAAAEHRALLVTVTGAPGIGKTTLLRGFAETQEARWATATPWETDLPGGVLARHAVCPTGRSPRSCSFHPRRCRTT